LVAKVSNSSVQVRNLLSESSDLSGKVGNGGFSIGVSGLKRVELDSKRVELSGEIVNGERKLGILISQVLDLNGEVVDSGLGIGKSSLER
jgi:hypothetical protein